MLDADALAAVYDEEGRTEYSKLRLRQTEQRLHGGSYNQTTPVFDNADNPHTLVHPQYYPLGAEPFTLKIDSNVMLVMDLHAHLAISEIIGFLAGSWDPKEQVVHVIDAFPCRSAEHDEMDRRVDVEVDPVAETEVSISPGVP